MLTKEASHTIRGDQHSVRSFLRQDDNEDAIKHQQQKEARNIYSHISCKENVLFPFRTLF